MNSSETAQQRQRWLSDWLDLEVEAQQRALDAPDLPAAWRQAALRLRDIDAREGVLDHDPARLAEGLIGGSPALPVQGWVVGRYRLDALIGQGGMAVVWSARHEDPELPQQVAVKFLRTTLSTPEWIGRFLREQRILARLSHQNISRLFDAGVSENGTPYIVMELIRGRPISEHCDALQLDCRQRVQMFIKVCEAVAYAHRNLIVHRDLKPGNVLVGDDGEPHLLDFGIAKLLDATGSDADLTRTGPALLTPAYAAPEQVTQGVITTATDVYGLGAMLHELLTGARTLHLADGRLQRPSTRVTAHAATTRAIGSAAALGALLRGDLDAILERALRREPELRYASAHELGEDLERWLDQAPVFARAGSWRYRADKFLRRHWLALGLAGLTLCGLSAATVISWRASQRADRAAVAALAEAKRARSSRDFMLELVGDLRPGTELKTPERLLDRAGVLVRTRFADDPQTHTDLLLVLGELERGYGRLLDAAHLLQAASASAHARQGDASEQWLEAEASLGHTFFRQGDYRAGRDRLKAALQAYDMARGPSGPARVLALMNLGRLQAPLDEAQEALRLQQEANKLVDALPDVSDALRMSVKEMYGEALAAAGQHGPAREVLRENLALARARFGTRDLAVVSALETLALRELEMADPSAAVRLLLEAKAIAGDLLEGPHVMSGYVENSLGLAELRLGHTGAAEAAYLRALGIYQAMPVASPQMLGATFTNLGDVAFEREDYASAAADYERGAEQRDLNQTGTRAGAFGPRCLASEAYARNAALDLARQRIDACLAVLHRDAVPDPNLLAAALGILADVQWRAGNGEAARVSAMQSLALSERNFLHEVLTPLMVLAELDHATGDAAAIARHAELAMKLSETRVWPRPCTTSRQLARLGDLAAAAALAEPARQLRQRSVRISCSDEDPAAQ